MDGAAGRSVRDVSADDVPVEHEHAGVDRRGGVRVIQDLIDIARGLLARVRREIEALTFLQRVVAREDAVVGRLGNADLLRLLRRTVHAPAEAREIGKARVVRRSVGRVRRSASAAGDERNDQDHNGQDQDACGDQPRL